VEAVEGDTRRQTCVLRGGPCGRDGQCNVHPAFYAAQQAIRAELGRATLDDLATGLTPP
jgi:DNA-binding IscR family transcriptional regulator